MNKCIKCEQQKGKRECPALHGNICSACCGKYKETVIDCAPDCPYLTSGSKRHQKLALKQYVSPKIQSLANQVLNRPIQFQRLNEAIIRHIAALAERDPYLTDLTIYQALLQLIEKEHVMELQPESLEINRISVVKLTFRDAMTAFINVTNEAFSGTEIRGFLSINLMELVLRSELTDHSRHYIDFCQEQTRKMSQQETQAQAKSRIII